MAKPTVRIALDKETLLKLLPEGDFESHIVFDNSVISLLNQTVNRLVNHSLLERFGKKLDHDIVDCIGDWSQRDSKVIIKKAIDEVAKKLIEETYQKALDDAYAHLEGIVKERLACAEKLVTQMTTPEAIEGFMVKACAALVKGKI